MITAAEILEAINGKDSNENLKNRQKVAAYLYDAVKKASTPPVEPEPAPYKSYLVNLSQTGTDAPVITELENDLGDIVWTRESQGVYRGTLDSAFPERVKVAITTGTNATSGQYLQVYNFDSDIIQINSLLIADDSPVDEIDNVTIAIRVYN